MQGHRHKHHRPGLEFPNQPDYFVHSLFARQQSPRSRGVQDLIRRTPGVVSTRVGYTGGDVPSETYRNHGDHAEAIEIIFDPAKINYRKLLEFFFQIHDPTTKRPPGQ
jgi:hypothetical protein